MSNNNYAIKARNIAKRYRLGLEEESNDSIMSSIFNTFKNPVKNFKKYRSLYKFDSLDPEADANSPDILWALKDVSFDIEQGEVVGIIGTNGAGKSTLLKVLSRITAPTKGSVEIRGKVSSLLEVGTGFHQELTGRENVYLNGTILGMKKHEVKSRFDEIIDFSGVEKFLDTPVKRYSSGMRVRLAFAVAAYLEPEILIIDEVLAVGDASFQRKCINKMQDVGKGGRTVLFVSHSMPSITRLCERAILLNGGNVLKDGPAHEVVSAYLGSGYGSTAEREWTDPNTAPGGDIARLRAVRIRAEDGTVSESVDITKPVAIEIEYEVLESGHILLPHFHVFNDEGVRIFVSLDQDPEWKGKPRPKGRYVSQGWIPGNLLTEGTHFSSAALTTLEPDLKQFIERDVVSFHVIERAGESARGDYAKSLRGVIRPQLEWQTKIIDKEVESIIIS